jgi:hypothetical protein
VEGTCLFQAGSEFRAVDITQSFLTQGIFHTNCPNLVAWGMVLILGYQMEDLVLLPKKIITSNRLCRQSSLGGVQG